MAIKRVAGLFLLGISSIALAQGAAPKAKYGPWGVDYTSMDKSVKPGDDFFALRRGHVAQDRADRRPTKSRAGYNYDMPDETEVEVRKHGRGGRRQSPPTRRCAGSPISTARGWTRPGSRRAAPRR